MASNAVADFGKVAVLYGGESAERQVSLNSGNAVHQGLCARGVDAHLVDTRDREAVFALKRNGFARAFVMLHGRGGEDGQIQGVLEWLKMPYTGSGVLACAVAMDKMMTKKLWAGYGLPVLPDTVVNTASRFSDLQQRLGGDFFAIKPIFEGSSVGISRVGSQRELSAAIQLAGGDSEQIMAERWVEGRELTYGVIADQVLPGIEIVASDSHAFYDYDAKYLAEDTRYLCPPPLTPELDAQLRTYTLSAFQSLGARGWGRVDFMLDDQNNPWLLEINLAPGMTSHSLVPQAAAKAGMDFSDLVIRVLSQTLSDRTLD